MRNERLRDLAFPIRMRWHGRGGQGVVTASRVVAEAALRAGLYPQSLPEFGAERSGAPIAAYNRIDRTPPVERGPVIDPAVIVVLDASLVGQVDIAGGLVTGGFVLINNSKSRDEMADLLELDRAAVVAVDASEISTRLIGRNLPNTPIIGALTHRLPFAPPDMVEEAIRSVMSSLRPAILEANINAFREGFEAAFRSEVVEHAK